MLNKMEQFFSDCEKNGISVYQGSVNTSEQIHIVLENSDDIIRYCIQNSIGSIFYEYGYHEKEVVEPIDKSLVIKKLTAFYKRQFEKYPYSLPLPNIDQSFYEPILNQVLAELDKDEAFTISSTTDNPHTDEDAEQTPDYLALCVLHSGFIIATFMELQSDEGDESAVIPSSAVTEKEVLNKYGKKILEGLKERYNKARIESERIRKDHEDSVLKEIEETVRSNSSLRSMATQKSRYEYADRLYAIWYREKGEEWLTKLAIRAIVDLQYVYATGGKA